jgi:ABC-type branched-subunit amino acid transport system ATPase component
VATVSATNKNNILLSCRDVTKRFGGVVALDGLNLDIRYNEIFGVIGPNGSGKTTFFNLLTGIFPLTSGAFTYEGRDLTNRAPQEVCRAGISRTFQRSRVCLGLSIFDNLMVGNHIHLRHDWWANLINRKLMYRQLEEMVERARALLQIFDSKLAGRMDELMGNQPMIDRRRVEICRALISGPRLLLLDEPSAGMTHREMQELMENLLQAKQELGDLTILLIEHEMKIIERVTNRCAVLNFGKKLCEGTYLSVVANPEVLTAYLGSTIQKQEKVSDAV